MPGTLKVQMPAGDIPPRSEVTKVRGTKVYVLTDRLRVFDPRSRGGDGGQEIHARDGTVFLIEGGHANVVSKTTELVWLVEARYLAHMPTGVPSAGVPVVQ